MATNILSRSLVVAAIIAASLGGVNAMSPQEEFIQSLRQQKGDAHNPDNWDNYSQADQAECRAQANSGFGNLSTKLAVMNDCLKAKWYRTHPAVHARKN
jgi:hypothetical protein